MDSVKFFYNKYSYPNTNQHTNRQKKQTKKILLKILSLANITLEDLKNKKVLVAGCGTGEKVKVLVNNNVSVTAIDFSENQLNKAKKSITNKSFVNFYKKDLINDNLFNLGKFDLILCLGVLHHTEDPKKGFINLVNLLNKDGVVIIGLYHKYSRLRYRIIRFLLRLFLKEEAIYNFIKKYQDKLFFLKASLPVLCDRYVVPYESYHTLKEVKNWFFNQNICFLESSDNVKGNELLKIFEKKTIFFVAGKKS
jgi:2-polyprenyl-3-methyl-5-hydroxy-6-metoxy-1,4-benzoquinol methylase